MKKWKYLSRRIHIFFTLAVGLLLAAALYLWNLTFHSVIHLFPAVLLSGSVILYLALFYRFVVLPYRETRAVYEQFVRGHILNDLFEMRYPVSEESERVFLKMQEMLSVDYLLNASKKQAEYLALQNQINPHFLYNTLEGIRSEAIIAGIDSLAEMTEALSTFFRYTISQVEHLVTLEDELSNIENYFYIQQFRFGEKLTLNICYEHDEDVSELDILQYRLPKLTLQPIVENSIYHGIERKIGKGHLTIKISLSDERLYIRVSDNGLGMSEERLKQLNDKLQGLSLEEEMSTSNKKGGIAIVNVNNRIKLLFGEEYGIYVYSREGSGTDVDITLPIAK